MRLRSKFDWPEDFLPDLDAMDDFSVIPSKGWLLDTFAFCASERLETINKSSVLRAVSLLCRGSVSTRADTTMP